MQSTLGDLGFVISFGSMNKSARRTVVAKSLCRLRTSSAVQIFGMEIKELYRTNYCVMFIILKIEVYLYIILLDMRYASDIFCSGNMLETILCVP